MNPIAAHPCGQNQRWTLVVLTAFLFGLLALFLFPGNAHAADAHEIDQRTNKALNILYDDVRGSRSLVSKARGVLVFPHVYKAAIGIGGEYGEGALRVGGRTVDYYNIVSASYGFQLGAQRKSIIMLFMEPGALEHFRNSRNFKVGADASVALIKVGAEATVDTKTMNKPIMAFVIDQNGLMYDLSLEGSKITKIDKD